MKKNNSLVIGVAALLVLCLAYIGIGQLGDKAEEKKEKQAAAEIPYMTDFTSVVGIAYDYEGEDISFTKDGDVWSYDGDSEFPVIQSKVENTADTVRKLEAVRKLEGGDGLAAYGLDQPVRRITVTPGEGEAKTILLGDMTEDGDFYAVIDGEETPWLISSVLYDKTSYSLEEYLKLEEFPDVEGTDIRSITVTEDGETEHYVKKTVDEAEGSIAWYKDSADSEENKLADNSALNVLADSLSSLKVSSCANYKVTEEELAGYGLDDPQVVLSYVYEKNGKEETFTLSVGGLNEDQTSYYTRTEVSKNVNEIPKADIDKCLNVDEEAGE